MRKRYLIVAGLIVALVIILALVVASCGGGGTTTTSAAATTTSAAPTTTAGGVTTTAGGGIDAAALFASDCGLSGCHSSVPTATADKAKTAIESGVGSSMPAFKDKLSADQIAALAAYVAAGGK